MLGLDCRSNKWGVDADSDILQVGHDIIRAVLQGGQCDPNTMILGEDMSLRPSVLFSPPVSLTLLSF